MRISVFGCLFLLLAGCGGEPFKHTPVSGKITYDDGTLIPIDLVLTFMPQAAPIDEKTHPRPGMAMVDKATGTFQSATTHMANDGLVRGKHKVTLATAGLTPLPTSVAPPEYTDLTKTPLEVDTAHLPFELKVRKPR
jgi:hypothetical protein